jgi:O-antigen/teichoic acid export membrane protein
VDEASVAPSRLRTDVFVTFGGKAATLLLGLATAVVVARQLGPSGQGVFAVAYSFSLVLLSIGGVGLTTANPYFAARQPAFLPRIVGNSLWLAAGLGLALAAIGAVVKVVAPGVIEGLGWAPLIAALVGLPGALAALFLQSVLLGEGRMKAYNGVEVAQGALTLGALIVAFGAFDAHITGALSVISASRYAAALAYLVLLARHSPRFRPDPRLVRSMMSYGFRVYVALVASLLVIRLDLLLVNHYLGDTQAGLYSVAAALADGMFVLPMVVGLNLFPRVARGDPLEASAEVFRSVAVLYGLVCLLTVPVVGPGIRLVFGEDYSGATSLYYWLLPGIYCFGMLTILSQHFAGRGFPLPAMAMWLVGLAVNLAINFAFLPGRGAWIAALASSISYAILLVLHIWLFAREAGSYASIRPRMRETFRFVRVALTK